MLVLPQKNIQEQMIFIFKETYLDRTDFINSPSVLTPPTKGKRMNMSSLFSELQMFGKAMKKYILSFLTNASLFLSSFWRKIRASTNLAQYFDKIFENQICWACSSRNLWGLKNGGHTPPCVSWWYMNMSEIILYSVGDIDRAQQNNEPLKFCSFL